MVTLRAQSERVMTAKACAILLTTEQADPMLQRIAPALEHAGVVLIVLNAGMQVVGAYGAVKPCIGSDDLPAAVPVLHIMPAATHHAWRTAHACIVAGSAQHAALHVERNDHGGLRHVAWDLTPLPADGDGPHVLCVGRDVTEQRVAEQQEQEIMALAVHELRAPVTALKGFAQLAFKRMESGVPGPHLRRMLQRIDEQSDRLADLLDRFVDMVRVRQGKLRLLLSPVDVVALVEEVLRVRQHDLVDRMLNVVADGRVTVMADRRRLCHALELLLGNALKSSPASRSVQITVHQTATAAHISVHGHGAHIPSDQQHRVWEPWYHAPAETHRQLGGMGLRLNMVKHIVEAHGGEVWVKAPGGQGNVFGFSLPLAA